MPTAPRSNDLLSVLRAAINDIAEHGYDSAERVAFWTRLIREAADRSLLPYDRVQSMLRDAFRALYEKLVDRGEVLRRHRGIELFTLEKVKPTLRSELDRRILASAELIKLNREEAVRKTIQRFSGWASSIPAGGSDAVKKRQQIADIKRGIGGLPFLERRVIIDQSHKMTSAINEILATDGGAIAVIWHSHWRQPGYDYREDHKERDQQVYAIRPNWALDKGLMKRGSNPFYDEITAFGEEIYCRCYGQYLYALRELPEDMLTARGRSAIEEAKRLRA